MDLLRHRSITAGPRSPLPVDPGGGPQQPVRVGGGGFGRTRRTPLPPSLPPSVIPFLFKGDMQLVSFIF